MDSFLSLGEENGLSLSLKHAEDSGRGDNEGCVSDSGISWDQVNKFSKSFTVAQIKLKGIKVHGKSGCCKSLASYRDQRRVCCELIPPVHCGPSLLLSSAFWTAICGCLSYVCGFEGG